MIICSGAEASIGVVTALYHNYYDYLGYEHAELLGQSINVLLPECLRPDHDQVMLGYLRAPSNRIVNSVVPVLMVHKHGHVVPGEIIVKTSLDCSYGIDFASFFTPGMPNALEDSKRIAALGERV